MPNVHGWSNPLRFSSRWGSTHLKLTMFPTKAFVNSLRWPANGYNYFFSGGLAKIRLNIDPRDGVLASFSQCNPPLGPAEGQVCAPGLIGVPNPHHVSLRIIQHPPPFCRNWPNFSHFYLSSSFSFSPSGRFSEKHSFSNQSGISLENMFFISMVCREKMWLWRETAGT